MKFLAMMILSGLMGASVFGKQSECGSKKNKCTPQSTVCLPVWGQNLIKNGDFQKNKCTSSSAPCIWNKSSFVPADVPGWLPNPNIEVGKANIFNSKWPNGTTNFVAVLDIIGNTCIKQKLLLKKGTYNLTFDWAPKQNQFLVTSKVNVKVNGQIVGQLLAATDYQIQKANILFVLKQSFYGSIELCGAGLSDGIGASVDNVKLVSYKNCR